VTSDRPESKTDHASLITGHSRCVSTVFLPAAGLGSRRHCDELIAAGRVNDQAAGSAPISARSRETSTTSKSTANSSHSERRLDIMLHKPAGFVSTRKRSKCARHDFRPASAHLPRLFNVGRLDAQTGRPLLLTNDGDLAQRLTHPRYKIGERNTRSHDSIVPWDPGSRTENYIRACMLDGQRRAD